MDLDEEITITGSGFLDIASRALSVMAKPIVGQQAPLTILVVLVILQVWLLIPTERFICSCSLER